MGLGELYQPSGKAQLTAKAVLQKEEVYAVNIAYGCPNGCQYCYGPRSTFQSREDWMNMRKPSEKKGRGEPVTLIRRQVQDGLSPEAVFISFLTDPYHPRNREQTEQVVRYLLDQGVSVATLSKEGVSNHGGVRHGMTICSLDKGFWKKYEPNTMPPQLRLELLHRKSDQGEYTWVSLEPAPCPALWDHDITELLERISFVDLVVYGKWNYDSRACTDKAEEYYRREIQKVKRICSRNGQRYHIKKETRSLL